MVLQRWQTVYLFIAAVVMGLAAFLPVVDVVAVDGSVKELALGALIGGTVPEMDASYAYFILAALSGLLALVSIFKYKKLKFQQMLCSVNMLLIVAAYLVLALCVGVMADGVQIAWRLSSLMPAFALVCLFLAKARIQHDYRLIHAADRLR